MADYSRKASKSKTVVRFEKQGKTWHTHVVQPGIYAGRVLYNLTEKQPTSQ